MKKVFLKKVLLLPLAAMLCFAVKAQTVSIAKTNATCLLNGQITATPASLPAGYNPQYRLYSGNTIAFDWQISPVFSSLPAGTYYVMMSDRSGGTTGSVQSATATITSSYTTMQVSVTAGMVGCATAANGSFTVNVTGGSAPYTYAITAGPAGFTLPVSQTGSTFNNLPAGSYTVSVTDNCGNTAIATGSVAVTATTVSGFSVLQSWIDYGGAAYGICSNPPSIFISNISTINTFDRAHFYWRYVYPAGSSNVYGAGGVLNGTQMPLTTNSAILPSTAAYPFASAIGGDVNAADIIIYDDCGNSYTYNDLVKQSNRNVSVSGIYDCNLGAGIAVNPNLNYAPRCVPITITATDNAGGIPITGTISSVIANPNTAQFYGFVPGHTYTVTGVDGAGNTVVFGGVSAGVTTSTTVTIPAAGSAAPLSLQNRNISLRYNNAAINVRLNANVDVSAGVSGTYTITASSNAAAVGITNTFSIPAGSTIFQVNGPNTADGSFPAGTYTLTFATTTPTNSCLNGATFTFTAPAGYVGSFNKTATAITPTCGAFGFIVQAALNTPPANYVATIISGPSNVGLTHIFNTTAVSTGVYNSLPFNGLTYGTYKIALYGVNAGSGTTPTSGVGYDSITVTYTADNALAINPLATGGLVCTPGGTGSIAISAISASGSALQYSIDGTTWQSSNTFSGLSAGSYTTYVKDACGNQTAYLAAVVNAGNITAGANAGTSPGAFCAGGTLQLSVNAVGATSYSWTGPNGFTSTLQNPVITNATAGDAGIYTCVVTTAACGALAPVSINAVANPIPTATIAYGNSNYCSTEGTTNAPSVTTTGSTAGGSITGTYSAPSGLSIDATTGAINAAASSAGTYTVTYTFHDNTLATACENTATAQVTINDVPVVSTTAQVVCAGSTVNLTASGVASSNVTGTSFTYWTDAAATANQLTNTQAQAVGTSGTYYIKGTTPSGCVAITPVQVTINAAPNVVITNPATGAYGSTIDLTAAAVTAGSDPNLVFSYYTTEADAQAGTNALTTAQAQAVSSAGTYYIKGTSTVTGCSSIQPVSVTLPITLSSFSAVKQNNTALLQWTTATEINNKGFGIQRSADAQSWSDIGFVNSEAANGNSSSSLNYSYTDNNPASGINYYRIKQIDLNGNAAFSQVKSVDFGVKATIYPNPVSSQLNVSVAGNSSYQLINAAGNVVMTGSFSTGNNVLNVSGITAGTYLLRIASNGSVVVYKVIKK